MRRGLALGAALGALDAGVVVLLAWALRRRTEVGWFAYSPMPRRYVDYLPADRALSGWAATALVAGVLVAVNMAAVAAYLLTVRRRQRQVEPGA